MVRNAYISWLLAMTIRRNKPVGRKRPIHVSEHDLWESVTADVKPLRGNLYRDKANSLSNHNQGPPLIEKQAHSSEPNISQASAPKLTYGSAPGLDKRTRLRLRRGQVNIEARLDLHGMNRSTAHAALCRFLEQAYMAGTKIVLVVTGKGLRQNGEIGVLRRAVPTWLNEESIRPWVHAFDHAAPRDGGEGALYIVMRRRR